MLLEGGVRVPFVMSWAGRLPAGRRFEHAISALDLAPTFLRLAGASDAQLAGLEGVDLWPLLTGRSEAAPHAALRWRFTISAALREGDWKLVRLPDRLPLLFNLRDDPAEQHDLALENLPRTKAMLARLGDWDVRLPHPVTLEGAEWKRRQLNLYDATFPLAQPAGGEAPHLVSPQETNSDREP
jgi:arylsulfatase A-like enzyme